MIPAQMSPPGSSSPSPRSPSNRPFLSVSVTDPVKLGNGVQAYISYRVITKTNFPDYQGPEKIVIRRYSDFVWLRDRLCEKYKGIFIPPLPEKSAVEKFRFTAEFIEMRRQALDIFINRVAYHPDLQQSDELRTFLQEDEETMEKVRAQETGIFKTKPSELMQIFKEVQSKVSDVVLGKEKPVEESTPEYEKIKHYVFELEDHLAEAQKHAFRLVKRHRELGQSLSDFGKAIKLLGACEGDSLGKAFSDLSSKSELLSIKLQKEAHNLLMNFEEPLKDYARAVQSIKATMADRANAFRQQWPDSSRCLLWVGELVDLENVANGGEDLNVRLVASELGKRKKNEAILFGDLNISDTLVDKDITELPLIDFSTITAATNSFSASNKLGEGGFGPVYKGTLSQGHEIVVKWIWQALLYFLLMFMFLFR